MSKSHIYASTTRGPHSIVRLSWFFFRSAAVQYQRLKDVSLMKHQVFFFNKHSHNGSAAWSNVHTAVRSSSTGWKTVWQLCPYPATARVTEQNAVASKHNLPLVRTSTVNYLYSELWCSKQVILFSLSF